MSELPQQVTIQQYIANGIVSVYSYNFQVLMANPPPSFNDIVVYVQPPGQPVIPASQIQPLGTAYTVQNVGEILGGTITFQSGYIPVSGAIVTISRNMAFTIDTEFNQVQNFNGQNLDNAFNRVVLEIQQLASFQDLRSIGYAINSYLPMSNSDQVLPVLGNQQIWQKISGAIQAVTLEENVDVSTLRSNLLSEIPGSDGASIIGYYDAVNLVPQTLAVFLNNLPTYIQNVVNPTTAFQPGMIIDTGSTVAPSGWLLCNGAEVSRVTYSSLFSNITFVQSAQLTSGDTAVSGLSDTSIMYQGMSITGTGIQPGTIVDAIVDANNIVISPNATSTSIENLRFYSWGVGDESTTFNVPNLNGQVTMGFGGTSLPAIGNVIGQSGGESNHSLTIAEIPAHTHTTTNGGGIVTNTGSNAIYASGTLGSGNISLNTTGLNQPHNIIQPSAVVMKIIKI